MISCNGCHTPAMCKEFGACLDAKCVQSQLRFHQAAKPTITEFAPIKPAAWTNLNREFGKLGAAPVEVFKGGFTEAFKAVKEQRGWGEPPHKHDFAVSFRGVGICLCGQTTEG